MLPEMLSPRRCPPVLDVLVRWDDKVEFVAHYEQDEVVKRECCLAARTNSFCNPWPAGSGKLRVMKILI